MNNHIARTWVLANLLHSMILFLYFGIGFSFAATEDIGILFPLIIVSFVFSLPSLALGCLAGKFISFIPATANMKLVVWIIAAPCFTELGISYTCFF